jgi:hypothetical protein
MTFTDIQTLIDFLVNTNSSLYTVGEKTLNVNRWYDRATSLIIQSDGRWQWDDSNRTTLPIATTNLVAGQADYSLKTDYIELERVEIMNSAGVFYEVKPYDISDVNCGPFQPATGTTGNPTLYDKNGNSIIFNVPPSYSQTGGIRIYFKRIASYFLVSDTTKEPGFNPIFHRYLALGAAYDFALARDLPQEERLFREIQITEKAIQEEYQIRDKTEQPRFKRRRYSFR